MFDAIASTYDRVNRLISGGTDRYMRYRLVKELQKSPIRTVLDLASGTGDQLITLFKHREEIEKGIALDLSKEMLKIGKEKFARKNLLSQIDIIVASAEKIPLEANSVDAVTISFGIRNIPNTEKALKEIARVLKCGGRALILETSIPKNWLLKKLYLFYFRHIMTRIGALVSRDKKAYKYLNQTSESFPCGADFCTLMEKNGFEQVKSISLFGGVANIYVGEIL